MLPTVYRKYDYREHLRLEILANWAHADAPIAIRWCERSTDDHGALDWRPICAWKPSRYTVAAFQRDHTTALQQLWWEALR